MRKHLPLTLVCLALSAGASAEGTVYTDGVDPDVRTINCDVPTGRQDGSPLAIEEIKQFDFYLTQDLGLTDLQPHVTDAQKTCTASFNLSDLGYGQWYMFAVAVDTNQRESVRSNIVPFVWREMPAPPNAPENVTLD